MSLKSILNKGEKMKDILPELNSKKYIKPLYDSYDIHFCKKEEVDELVDFLQKYWKENHILVLSRELLDWQHYDKVNNRYNYVIAKEKSSKEIHSILGFIPTWQYDENIQYCEVFPCIWKSRKDVNAIGLGTVLYHYLKENLPIETISILGISKIALSKYKQWGFSTGKINHYVIINENISNYELMANVPSIIQEYSISDGYSLSEIDPNSFDKLSENDAIFDKYRQYKSKNYYKNRYLIHPMYKYVFYGIFYNNQLVAILITRLCGHKGKKCLRIVDYIGEEKYISNIGAALHRHIAINNIEYVDFVHVGLSDNYLRAAGFINKADYKDFVVPNYFEPFLLENIELDYAYKTVRDKEDVIFFKADADQDRPNLITNND